jgi:hypothetical protein
MKKRGGIKICGARQVQTSYEGLNFPFLRELPLFLAHLRTALLLDSVWRCFSTSPTSLRFFIEEPELSRK